MLKGIDISNSGQGLSFMLNDILPKNPDIDFVIVKATEGTTIQDKSFKRNIEQAIINKKLIGCYHFMSSRTSISDQVDNFINVVNDYLGKAIMVLDFEGSAVTRWGPDGALQFCKLFEEKTGVKPLIYMSASVTRNYNWDNFIKNDFGLWVAQYNNDIEVAKNSIGKFKLVAIKQYTSRGILSGWMGNIDMNIAYMSKAGWKKYAARRVD